MKKGWGLTRKSWQVLRADRSLLLFPLLSAIASFVALLVFLVPAAGIYLLLGDLAENDVVFYLGVFLATLLSTIVAVFFNVALVSQVARSLEGEDTNIKDGIAFAWGRKRVIVEWALLAAVVGTVLRIIEDRLPLGSLLSALGGFAWAVASWFVIPVLVFEEASPFDALRRSADTVRRRWGEGVVGVAVIGGVFALLLLVAFLLFIGLGALIVSSTSPLFLIPLALLFFPIFVLLSVTSSAMQQIFNTAVFLSISENGKQIGPWSEEDIDGAVIRKKEAL